jgi:CBS domain-containing protein
MLVRELMKEEVITVDPELPLFEAAKAMGKNRVGCVVVTEKRKVVGILTERDVLLKVVAEKKDVSKVKAKDVMSSPVITISPDEELDEAISKFSELRIRRLPVVENQNLVGIITSADIISILPEFEKMLETRD